MTTLLFSWHSESDGTNVLGALLKKASREALQLEDAESDLSYTLPSG